MLQLRLPLLSALLLESLLLFASCGALVECRSSAHHSDVAFDVATGGYHDIAVIVSPALNREECPQILHDIKVK